MGISNHPPPTLNRLIHRIWWTTQKIVQRTFGVCARWPSLSADRSGPGMIQGSQVGDGGQGTEPTFSSSKAKRPQPPTARASTSSTDEPHVFVVDTAAGDLLTHGGTAAPEETRGRTRWPGTMPSFSSKAERPQPHIHRKCLDKLDRRPGDPDKLDRRARDPGQSQLSETPSRSAETRSADTRSADTRSADTRSADTRSADTRSADTRSADTRSAEKGDHSRSSRSSIPKVSPGRSPTARTASRTPGVKDARSVESCRIVRVSPAPPRSTSW
jgi:hypothetical protein